MLCGRLWGRGAAGLGGRGLRCSAALGRKERRPNPEKLKEQMESAVDVRDLSQFDPSEIGHNDVAKRKGLVRPVHSAQESIDYLSSATYKETYEGLPVHAWYRRNIKGQERYQGLTRDQCVDPFTGRFVTNQPCPLCRDEYLVLDATNVELLRQFLDNRTGEVMHELLTGVCKEQQIGLKAAVLNAKRHGFLEMRLPFRRYNYAEWYPGLVEPSGEEGDRYETEPQPLQAAKSQAFEKAEFIPEVARPNDTYWERWEPFTRLYGGYPTPRPRKPDDPNDDKHLPKKKRNLWKHIKRPDFTGFKY